jgi:hypothetical protein
MTTKKKVMEVLKEWAGQKETYARLWKSDIFDQQVFDWRNRAYFNTGHKTLQLVRQKIPEDSLQEGEMSIRLADIKSIYASADKELVIHSGNQMFIFGWGLKVWNQRTEYKKGAWDKAIAKHRAGQDAEAKEIFDADKEMS